MGQAAWDSDEVNASTSFHELAGHLELLTESASRIYASFSEKEWREPYAPGKWTRLEVLGDLVDSAAHNHQRFARALHEDPIAAPGYDGEAQVRAQNYGKAPITAIVNAWRAYNQLISFVVAQIPPEKELLKALSGALLR